MDERRVFWIDTISGPGDRGRCRISCGGAEEEDDGPVCHRTGPVCTAIEVLRYSLEGDSDPPGSCVTTFIVPIVSMPVYIFYRLYGICKNHITHGMVTEPSFGTWGEDGHVSIRTCTCAHLAIIWALSNRTSC